MDNVPCAFTIYFARSYAISLYTHTHHVYVTSSISHTKSENNGLVLIYTLNVHKCMRHHGPWLGG